MDKTEPEKKFEEYRKYLHQEAERLANYIRLYQRLHERQADRLNEMNIAPAFFQIVIDALFSVIVLWVSKLFGKESKGLLNFLTFCERNRNIFEIKELQRRRNYLDNHYMLNKEQITFKTIQEDKERINNLESLRSFTHRRDKFHAHFDNKYFFDRKKLSEDAPLKWSDLEELIKFMKDIINKYSTAYDGSCYSLNPINVTDIDNLLNYLHGSKR